MKTILIQINKGECDSCWFQLLYSQLQNEYKLLVIEELGGKTGRKWSLIDFSLKIESLYNKQAVALPGDNHSVEVSHSLVSEYELALNLSSSDLVYSNKPTIELYYRGRRLSDSIYVGVLEHLDKEATIDIDVVLSIGGKQFLIEQANYRGHWSVLKNKMLIYYSLPSLVHKVLYKVLSENYLKREYVGFEFDKRINYTTSIRYFISVLHNITNKYLNALGNILFHTSGGQEWTVFLGEGSFLESDTTQLRPIVFPKGEFWADPFLFVHKGELWLFFERFPYKTNKGLISCTKIVEGKPTTVIDVLDKRYHLSYPNIFEEDGEIYMIPECSAAKRLEVYRCVHFPTKWELYSTAFEGESFADSIYFRDDNGDRWLFSSKESPLSATHCNELWGYRIDSLKFESIEPHKQNPIIINAGVARNGGTIYRENGRIYRASQDNSFEMYGNGVCINEITHLSLTDYHENLIKRIDTKDVPGIIGMHHMDQINGYFVLDGRLK